MKMIATNWMTALDATGEGRLSRGGSDGNPKDQVGDGEETADRSDVATIDLGHNIHWTQARQWRAAAARKILEVQS